jgi:cell division protein FtsL
MTRLNIFFALLVVLSALSVVTARHEARKSFLALQSVQKEARGLEVVWERLLLQQASATMYDKVETVATRDLAMKSPEASRIRVLTLDDVAAVALDRANAHGGAR